MQALTAKPPNSTKMGAVPKTGAQEAETSGSARDATASRRKPSPQAPQRAGTYGHQPRDTHTHGGVASCSARAEADSGARRAEAGARGGRKEEDRRRGERGKPAGPQDDRRGLMTSHNGRPPRVVEPVCSARVAP